MFYSFVSRKRKNFLGGTELMKQMLELLRKKGYKRASLSVQKDNYALHMYQKVGFKPVIDNDEEFIMEYRF